MPAVLTASTWRTSSCWPWSYSPVSRPVSRRPVPEMVTPISSRRFSDGHSRSLGPSTSAVGFGGGRLEQPLERVGRRVGVVVEQPDPLRRVGGDLLEADPHRLGVRRTAGDRDHLVEGVEQEIGALVAAAGVDADHAAERDGLAAQTVDDGRQPPGPVVADDQSHDRRIHGESP